MGQRRRGKPGIVFLVLVTYGTCKLICICGFADASKQAMISLEFPMLDPAGIPGYKCRRVSFAKSSVCFKTPFAKKSTMKLSVVSLLVVTAVVVVSLLPDDASAAPSPQVGGGCNRDRRGNCVFRAESSGGSRNNNTSSYVSTAGNKSILCSMTCGGKQEE